MTPRMLAWACLRHGGVLARWRFWPWPAPGEAPALDLVAVYDPALYWAFWLWGWAWPAAGVGVGPSLLSAGACEAGWWARRRPMNKNRIRGADDEWPAVALTLPSSDEAA